MNRLCQRCENSVELLTYLSMPPHDEEPKAYCLDCALSLAAEVMPKDRPIKVLHIKNRENE